MLLHHSKATVIYLLPVILTLMSLIVLFLPFSVLMIQQYLYRGYQYLYILIIVHMLIHSEIEHFTLPSQVSPCASAQAHCIGYCFLNRFSTALYSNSYQHGKMVAHFSRLDPLTNGAPLFFNCIMMKSGNQGGFFSPKYTKSTT